MIGIFDSGLGGLTVLEAARKLLPEADIVYVADRGRAPYGPRPLPVVRGFAEEITECLLSLGSRAIVIACNSASAAALHHLRSLHPNVPFVGMEPAIKPAATQTRSRVVGVLTTAATFQGELLASVINRFAVGIEVVGEICDGWVELVESGVVEGTEVVTAVQRHVEPLIEKGADTLVLGCTHYPFLMPAIQRVAGPEVTVIDPSVAVARRVSHVALENDLARGTGSIRLLASGALEGLSEIVDRLSGLAVNPEPLTCME